MLSTKPHLFAELLFVWALGARTGRGPDLPQRKTQETQISVRKIRSLQYYCSSYPALTFRRVGPVYPSWQLVASYPVTPHCVWLVLLRVMEPDLHILGANIISPERLACGNGMGKCQQHFVRTRSVQCSLLSRQRGASATGKLAAGDLPR